MITPAVLISACGALILSTSQRLGRTTDRVRSSTARFKTLVTGERAEPLARDEKRMIIAQIPRLTRRVRYLQRSLIAFYSAVSVFVLTSVVIGGELLLRASSGVLPVVLGLIGAGFLSFGSVLLIVEANLSYGTTLQEMRFLQLLGSHYAGMYADEDGPGR